MAAPIDLAAHRNGTPVPHSHVRFGRVPVRAAKMKLGERGLSVLIAIARFADGEGQAYPSLNQIAAASRTRRNDVPRVIARLERSGLIVRERRRDPRGGAARTHYTIVFGEPPERLGVAAPERLGVAAPERLQVSDHLNRPESHTLGEPSDGPFDRFWSVYPSRSDDPRKPAAVQFAALVRRGADAETIIRGATRFAGLLAEDRRWVPFAARWLREERWLNYPEAAAVVARQAAISKSEAEWRAILAAYKAGDCRADAWPKGIGLRPENAATNVPRELRRELGFA